MTIWRANVDMIGTGGYAADIALLTLVNCCP